MYKKITVRTIRTVTFHIREFGFTCSFVWPYEYQFYDNNIGSFRLVYQNPLFITSSFVGQLLNKTSYTLANL